MTKPVTIPNTFATATTAIPLSNLDADFSTVATAMNDANTYSNYAPDTGSANAYVVTLTGVSTLYSAGLRIQFKAGNANTTASTLNVNGQGAKNITYQDASAIASGTIAANSIVDVMYDGTQFLLMNDPAGATGGDVVGPSSATDNAVVRFDGTTGKLVQNSVVTIADSTGDVAGVGALTASGNVTLSGGTANGVLYLNGSKVATSGSALTFDGTTFGINPNVANSTSVQITGAYTGSGTATLLAFQRTGGAVAGAIRYNDSAGDIEFGTTTSHPLAFLYGGSEQMRLTSTGLKSSIAGTNADPVFSYTSDTNTGIFFPAADKLGFTAGGGTDQMVLTTTGLGIGTSSPAYKLDLTSSHDGYARQWLSAVSFISSADAVNGFQLRNLGSGTQGIKFANFANTVEWMRLDSSGNLGLGVTPSAWANGYRAIDVGATGAFTASSNTFDAWGNAYYNGSSTLYKSTQFATMYRQEVATGKHIWYTAPSGTAGNPISFTQAMTLDASGNLGIGTASPGYRLEVVAPSGDNITALFRSGDATAANNAGGGFRSISSATATSRLAQVWLDADGANLSGGDYFFIQKNGNSGTADIVQFSNAAMTFATNNTERARITSGGDLLVGRTSAIGGARVSAETTTGNPTYAAYLPTTGAETAFLFVNPNGTVGSITTNGSATAYNTSSDYRLKNNQQPLTGSGAFIDALKPKTWNWKADGSRGVGFIAHEVQEVSPGSVVGTKDAVDADGKPVMQAMEYGSAEFIANIIAELQSLRQRVALLEGN